MSLPITTLSAVALSFILFVLALRVIGFRRSEGVSLGDGGKDNLQRAMRGQANLIEYALFATILIFLAELQGGFSIVLAVVAALFVIGRMCCMVTQWASPKTGPLADITVRILPCGHC